MPKLTPLVNNFQLLRKRILLTVSLAVIGIILAGCSLLPGGKEPEAVTLKYWGLWENADTINQVVNDYKKLKPNVNIVYEKKSPQQYRESLQNQIEAGKGPDLFRFHNTWTPVLKNELDVVPSDLVSTSDFKKNFYPTVFFDLRNNENNQGDNKFFIHIFINITKKPTNTKAPAKRGLLTSHSQDN